MLRKIITLCVFMFGIFVVSSFAQRSETPKNERNQNRQERRGDRNQQGNRKFNEMDLNNDGYISASEWTKGEKSFKRIDLDNDGRISRQEFENGKRNKNNQNPNS